MEKVLEYSMTCPVCGSAFSVSDYLYEVPYYGKILISSGVCPKCGFKWRDVRVAESRGPTRILFKVVEPRDLNVLVVKSSTATLRIEELGVDVTPGYSSEGYITTVEGLIQDAYEKLKILCSAEPSTSCAERQELFERALSGELELTIEIHDPMGVSKVLSSKAIEEPLSER